MTTTINLTKSNRAVGLVAELADLIASEDSSLELARIQATLHSLMTEARSRSQLIEMQSKTISKAARSQTIKRKPMSSRIAALTSRC